MTARQKEVDLQNAEQKVEEYGQEIEEIEDSKEESKDEDDEQLEDKLGSVPNELLQEKLDQIEMLQDQLSKEREKLR